MPPSQHSRGSHSDDVELGPLLGKDDESDHSNVDLDDDDPNEKEPSPLKGGVLRLLQSSGSVKALSACALYSFCSVSMILVNKSLASRYVVVCGSARVALTAGR
jgi:hypothetical protein